MSMHISFLLSFTPNPRMNKRLRLLKEEHEISLIYWKRSKEYLWGDVLADTLNDIHFDEVEVRIENKKLFGRIISTIKFARAALFRLKKYCPKCVYTQNLDMLFIASLYRLFCNSHLKIIYEVADIHEILIQPQKSPGKKIIQWFLRFVECRLCKNISLIVLTSDQFYERYYNKIVLKDKYLYLPNMPEKRLFSNYRHKEDGIFTVGFIGAARFPRQIKNLVQACKKTHVELEIIGSFLDKELEEYCKNEDVTCYGKYNYETEIAKLYGRLDCVFSAYPVEDFNVDIALPNKLYESIICELPIIVSQGTYLGEIVEKYKIGVSIDCNNIESYKQAIMMLRDDTQLYQEIVQNCRTIKGDCYADKYGDKLRKAVGRLGTED